MTFSFHVLFNKLENATIDKIMLMKSRKQLSFLAICFAINCSWLTGSLWTDLIAFADKTKYEYLVILVFTIRISDRYDKSRSVFLFLAFAGVNY